MKIEVSKNELAGALGALGKLVSRTSPVEAFRSVEIDAFENKITLRTANADESIAFSIAAEVAESFSVLVNFDDFRTVVRCSRNKMLTLALENGLFSVDGLSLRLIEDTLSDVPAATEDCITATLPPNFVGLLAQAAPIVNRNEYRKVLQGVHLCPEGLVVTNGKELLHVELPLELVPVTLPFPLALLATKCDAGGSIATWTKPDYRYFRIELGNWSWSGKALVGTYPNWKVVVPDAAKCPRVVKLDAQEAEKLTTFLKSVPDNPPNNPVTLSQTEDGTALELFIHKERHATFSADFTGDWRDFSISLDKNLLLRMLAQGHLQFACSDQHAPFVGTLGTGKYVAMPLASCAQNTQIQNNEQPQNEEEKEMNESVPNVVAVPMQPVAVNNNNVSNNAEPAAVNPLDELAAAIDDFKGRIRAMFEEATNLTKKVKEVSIAQKQKERDFIQARRALDRIRMAI